MASNFRIFHHRNSDHLHISLVGDFDGSSAHELVNALNQLRRKAKKIVIHTSRLTSLHPFGVSVFQKKCGLLSLVHMLTFTGTYSRQMSTEADLD